MAVKPPPSFPDEDGVIRLADFLPYQISVLAHRIARETAAIVSRHEGLNISQWRVMAAVAETPGRTANEVVAVTPMDKGIVSRAVKALLDKGMLERRASAADGRLGHLFLTAKGQRKYALLATEIRRIETALLAALPDADAVNLKAAIAVLCRDFPARDAPAYPICEEFSAS